MMMNSFRKLVNTIWETQILVMEASRKMLMRPIDKHCQICYTMCVVCDDASAFEPQHHLEKEGLVDMMTKYIVRAENTNDIVSLMTNTGSALTKGIEWSSDDIFNAGECGVEEWEVSYHLGSGDVGKVDELIMGPEVPVGGMVVICDGRDEPEYGFVCGNGCDWYKVDLPYNIKETLVAPKMYGVDLGIRNRKMRWFDSISELKAWIVEGMGCCDGAEADHYVKMLSQLESGKNVVKYW